MTTLSAAVTPGSVVIVRDEEWLVTSLETSDDVTLLSVQGLSELARGTSATFYDTLDDIEVHDPARSELVGDDSPGYRRSRLWLEPTRCKTPVRLSDPRLTVSTAALATPLVTPAGMEHASGPPPTPLGRAPGRPRPSRPGPRLRSVPRT